MSRLTVGILLLLLAAGAVFFFIMPQWTAVTAARDDITQLQSLNDELTHLGEQRDALTREYNAISSDDLEKLNALAPRDSANAKVLGNFDVLASAPGLSLERVDFLSNDANTAPTLTLVGSRLYGIIPVTLSLRGNYEGFRKFLIDLEHNLRLMDVDDINLGIGSGSNLAITVRGKIYFRR
jgi:Tfp pilus assembly protein PilO